MSGIIGRWLKTALAAMAIVGLMGVGGAGAATTVDLGVSSYTWSPNLVVHNGTATFSATVTNNDQFGSADGLTLTVALPSNVDFSTATTASTLPGGCVLPNPYTTLTCTKTTLAALATWTVSFKGIGSTSGVQNSTASVVATANIDNNSGNDSLTQPVTEINGADLAVTTTGVSGCSGTTSGTTTCATTAGSNYSFTVNVSNNGPDAASTFNVTNNLPAVADFTYASASGTGWSCSHTGTTVTCGYSGLNSGASAAPITITGQVITSAGTITDGASVASTDALTGDPVSSNNGPSQVVVNVVPGTNLQANKTLVSAVTGLTSFTAGEAVNLTLSASNTGTQSAAGISVSDTISGDFSIPSPLGVSGCSATGQVVTCTVGALAAGATSSPFVIPLTVVASPTLGSGSNSASVARTDGTAGSNTPVTVNYSIVAPFAHLTLTKTKTPNPVVNAGTMTSTITVTNSSSSTSAATGTITVTDALGINETYVSNTNNGWSCSALPASGTSQTVTCTYGLGAGSLARGASLPNLVIQTTATGISLDTPQSISNTACTGYGTSTGQSPLDNAANTCVSKTVTASLNHVDLSIAKVASIAAPTHVLSTDSSYTYTLTVSNAAGKDIAPTVNVSDPLPEWYSANVLNSAVITSPGTGELCSVGSTVTCTLKNLAGGSSRTITITLNRPVKDGSFTNTATVSTPDAIDDVPGNNSGSASVVIDAVAVVAVTGIADAPHPVKVGESLTYTTSIKNNGPSVAANVVVYHSIDASKVNYVAASASLTGSGSPSCAYTNSFAAGPYTGQAGVQCSGFNMANGESRQLTFKVIPVYPYPDGSSFPYGYISNAAITTTTAESSSSNNTGSNTASVTIQALDLSVTNTDSGYDPVGFGGSITYQITASNNGPSQATNFKLTVTPTPPTGGSPSPYTMVFNSLVSGPTGATCGAGTGADTGKIVCILASSNVLAANASAAFQLKFDTGPSPTDAPASSITYSATATVISNETTAGYDSLPGNNSVTQTTTALPVTDLAVISKSVTAGSPFNLNQPFTYTVKVGNKGPSPASGVKVTDVLPAGLVVNGGNTAIAVTATGFTLSTSSCSTSGTSPVTVTCNLGTLPADATLASDFVTIDIPVRAAYQASGSYAFSFNTNLPNTATIAPLPNTSYDPISGNDTSNTVNVQIQKSSISGTVYSDNNLNNGIDSGEGLNGVTLTLSGTDSYGYTYGTSQTYAALTATSNSSGVFTFDKLPPGTWQIVENQPSGYADVFETAGNAGGTVPAATCDGVTNCASSIAANTISAITLPAATAATGYVFQEYQNATVSGYVYSDLNNDGQRAASGEAGISGVTVTLTGTTYNGTVYSGGTALTTTTNASGVYTFTVPPADASGYTVTETQASGYLNGKTTAGAVTGTNAVAGTATGANSDVIQAIKVYANGSSSNNNFGELLPANLSGYVYIDANNNATRDTGETTGVTGVTVSLAGTDDLNAAVSLTTTTASNGAYSFTSLRPGSYTVTETQLASLTLTGAQAGAKGGTINGSVRSAGTGVAGSGNNVISAITLAPNDTAGGYNFGESGQGLSGFVYVDLNNNGVKDTGEPGIAGVTVTLSGSTSDDVNVCVAISPNPCTVTTDSNGGYGFVGLPASNGAGYTLTEQSQASAPLSSYVDGLEQLGTGLATPGMANNDNFSGINVPTSGFGSNYNFGEKGGSLAGLVYYDKDNSGGFNSGDSGLGGVTITLSGTGCSSLPAGWCTTTTASDGTYSFTGLPTGTYALTETQPVDYANGTTASGSPAGTSTTGTAISAIPLTTAGANGSGYNFGEKSNTLSGYVYMDANNDGIKGSGEAGIPGASVTLSGNTASGTNVCATIPSCIATTDANGLYTFVGLDVAGASGYTVTLTQPSSTLVGKVTAGTQNSVTKGTVATHAISGIAFDANYPGISYNFGELQSTSVSGAVYLDVNNNGAQDSGDLGLAGVAIALNGTDDLNAAVSANTNTAADGSWSFTGLRPGTYTVTETQPVNYAEGTNTVGSKGGSAVTDVGVDSKFTGISIASGNAASAYLFGEKGGVISGFVYVDANDNGSKDNGETGIGGVTLTLTGTSVSGSSVSLGTTSAAADGSYSFNGLPAANAAGYMLTETQPANYLDGKEKAGSLGGTVNNTSFGSAPAQNLISVIPLTAGAATTDNDFGETQAATISGVVYLDANNNGIQDNGETGIKDVTVTLSGKDDQNQDITQTAVTDAYGAYSFTGLRPSSSAGYILTETQPTAYLDGLETPGKINGAQVGTAPNTAFDATPGNNQISAIVLGSGQSGSAYLFGERGGTLHGYVYFDENNDGLMAGSLEVGLANIHVTLSGAISGGGDVCAVIPTCSTTTDASGAYSFVVPPGTYTLQKSQSDVATKYLSASNQALYADGKETAGVAGGTVDNSHFGSNPGYNSISGIVVTPSILASNNGDLGGYLFGVDTAAAESNSLVPPIISGYVYQDLSHKRIRPTTGSTPSLVNGWTVALTATLSDNSKEVICVVQTAADANGDPGFYHFDNLACAAAYPKWKNGLPYSTWVSSPGVTYSSFAISFSNPGGVVSNTDAQSLGGAGQPRTIGNAAQIAAITLHPGDDIIEQNLPLDPSGVVYDAISRQTLKGAVVTLSQGGTAVDPTCLVSGQNPETTGSDGFYQFLLLPSCSLPSATYAITVAAPTGYASGSSTMIPPTAAPPLLRFDGIAATLGDVDPIQSQAGPPALGGLTRYYLNIPLTLTGVTATSSSNVVNNHIPLDPVSPGVILMSKSTPLLNVSKGDLVPYVITATNQAAGSLPLGNIDVVDTIPPGFAYKKGSAVLGNVRSEPLLIGRVLKWPKLSFTGNETKTWKMLLVTGAGVSEGEYTNIVWAINDLTGGVDSNVAAATVRIVPDPTFDCSEIIGKVFDDQNTNGYEDEGEPGLPNVRVVTVNGLLVTTDREGRFHVACADIPQDLRGSNFMMKLDERTLPSGYRVTTENPRVVRTTRGKMVKLNFGAAIHRVVRLELSDAAFRGGHAEPGVALARALDKLPTSLRVKPSVLRLAYRTGRGDASLAKDRLRAVRERIEALWKAQGCCYTLVFEEEIFERAPAGSAK